MKGSPAKGDGKHQEEGGSDLTAAARVRRGTTQFLPSFVALQEAVNRSCSRSSEWEARVGAGIRAALDFAAADPDAASALTIQARREASSEGDREREVVGYFARLLGEVTPADVRFPISTDEGVVESIAITIRGHLLAETHDELPALAPELIYLALMPYTGLAGARRWAESPALAER